MNTLRSIRKNRLAAEELEPRVLMSIATLLNRDEAILGGFVAVKSGAWSDPATWSNNVVPTNNAKVLILPDISVVYDAGTSPNLAWIRDEGALTFADTKDESLLVET